jgi:hypothetical protein
MEQMGASRLPAAMKEPHRRVVRPNPSCRDFTKTVAAFWLAAFAGLASMILPACDVDEASTRPARPDPFQLRPPHVAEPTSHNPFLSLPEPITSSVPASTTGPLISSKEEPVVKVPTSAGAHPESEDDKACPDGMALVHGDACPDARQVCADWMDPEDKKRCRRFEEKITCVGPKKHLRFCIDKLEYAPAVGERPLNDVSWTMSKEICESKGKRLCYETEWVFACEGEEMKPYPTGLTRPSALCNFDKEDLVDNRGKLRDFRQPADANPGCVSPFGVVNMVGNVDEWTWKEGNYTPMRAYLKGGWWLAGRNRCRPATTAHDEYYHDTQTGFRCCKDP